MTANSKSVGVIGAGSFGTAVSNILAQNSDVILYVRTAEKAEEINRSKLSSGQTISENIVVTSDLEEVVKECEVIFPVVPSYSFRSVIKKLSPLLHPYHILIHGTKGLDFKHTSKSGEKIQVDQVMTMSQVIRDESDVVRIGCIAGPNLAKELYQKYPAATVIASPFKEVIKTGQKLLRNDRFQVYESNDLVGIELCGVLKNIIAIASGALSGLGYGENSRSLLVSRGLVEMIQIGKMMGGRIESFIGLAGVGDLFATSSSTLSRNYNVGYKLAKGETLDEIIKQSEEVAEGINTIKIIKGLLDSNKNVRALITEKLYDVLFEGESIQDTVEMLMKFPLSIDIDLTMLYPEEQI
ncbi:MAG: NAD(P)H-dependent glycerol-3-phosphate dehydrogenase [Bacteroidota bacterium]